MLPRLGILSDTDSPLRSVRCIDIGSTVKAVHGTDSDAVFTTSGTKRIERLARLGTAPGVPSLRFHIEK
jgi:hypothetical protein